jgi:L-ascorbate 6-phosphate lactonase
MTSQPHNLAEEEAELRFLGQAGYIIRSGGVSVAVDPYLTDSVGAASPDFKRLFPPPLAPEELKVDFYIVTHDHGDHLDPDTVRRYRHREDTHFVAPRFAALKLIDLGVPAKNVIRLEAGEQWIHANTVIKGVFALPTGTDVIDTTGYLITFANGRSIYHTSDTGFATLLLKSAPKNVDVLLVPINGKWGNLTIEQALDLTAAVNPRYVLPNHYDLMALNAENPETFRWLCQHYQLGAECVIPSITKPIIWK